MQAKRPSLDVVSLSDIDLPRADNTSSFVLRWTGRLFDDQPYF